MERKTTNMKHKAVWGARIGAATMLSLVLGATSCSQTVRTGDGSSYLVITSIVGGPNSSATVESDVVSDEGDILQDGAEATMTLQMKDITGAAPSAVNAITITQYHVEYIRSDGRNVQGVDVPFAFDSGMTITVSPTGQGQQTFDLVRVSAKREAPLLALVSNFQTLDVIADVTFFGKDMHNNDVMVTGSIGITFANHGG